MGFLAVSITLARDIEDFWLCDDDLSAQLQMLQAIGFTRRYPVSVAVTERFCPLLKIRPCTFDLYNMQGYEF